MATKNKQRVRIGESWVSVRVPNPRSSVYWMRFRLECGRVVWQSTGKTDAGDALQFAVKACETEQQRAAGTFTDYAATLKTPVSEIIADFCEAQVTATTSDKHQRGDEAKLERLRKDCGWITLRDMTPDSFERWRSRQAKAADGLGPASRNRYLAVCKRLWAWLRERRRVAENVFDTVRKETAAERAARQDKRWMTEAEQRKLMTYLASDEPEPMFSATPAVRALLYRVALETGLRANECRQLMPADIEPDCLTIRAAAAKNRHDATIPLRPGLASLLLSRCERLDAGEPVFPSTLCQRAAEALRDDAKAAGIPEQDGAGRTLTFHGLRVTFATTLLRAGQPVNVVKRLMRHSTITLTADLYGKLAPQDQAAAVSVLPDLDAPVCDEFAKPRVTA